MIKFTAQAVTIDAAAGEEGSRTISGIAVPYGVDAVVMGGQRVRVEAGALPTDGPAPRLLQDHDPSQVVGVVVAREDTSDGMLFSAKIAKTRAGDDLLELLQMGAYDSVSIGIEPTDVEQDGRTTVVKAANWSELSVVYQPAFEAAKITQIAASAEDEADPDEPETPQESEEDTTMSEQTPEVVEAAAPVVPTPSPIYAQAKSHKLPSAGEYIAALRAGGHDWHQLNDNIRAATGDVVVSDAGGVVPVPIVAPIFDSINPLRPIVSALGPRAMPDAGATFIRPYVKVRSSVGAQSSELSALSTADFEVDDLVVTKKTFGGKLILSEQVIDWSSPSMLDAAITDMASQYALATEKEVVDTMAAAVTNSQEVVITSFTDDAEFITDLYLAASSMAETGNYLPNALVVSPKRWASLGALVDGQGRPVFPQVAPMTGIGTLPGGVTAWNGNPLGLQLVVSNQITDQEIGDQDADDYYWLINTRGIEVYEQYKGFIRDESVGTLGVTIATRGYFAAKVIDVNMIRILGPDATFT
ncbi:MAG TPA: HK97 family phage prohead protease [Acidimicrobiia bacterium]